MVQLARNELANRGIEAIVQGEYAAGLVGAGSAIDAWVELWILDETRLQEAAEVVHSIFTHPGAKEGGAWTCSACGEEVEGTFTLCWNCGHEQPEPA